MSHKEIEVIIQPDGSVHVEAVGFAGPDCEQATRFLEQAIGIAKKRQRKPEYYRARSQAGRNEALNG